MTRKRKDIDLENGKKKADVVPFDKGKKKYGFQPGQSGNPFGRPKGLKDGATYMQNKIKEAIAEGFQRGYGISILLSMLDGRTPKRFFPPSLMEKIKRGEPLAADEKDLLVRVAKQDYKWAMEWIGKQFPKELLTFGHHIHEYTIAGATKQAETEDKSPHIIDMEQKRIDREIFEAGSGDEDAEWRGKKVPPRMEVEMDEEEDE